MPTFGETSELARYIHPSERAGKNRAAISAFRLDADDLDSAHPHLSVNSTEVEAVDQIVAYFQKTQQSGTGDVTLCFHNVKKYVELGKANGANLIAEKDEWKFLDTSGYSTAFKHRPVKNTKQNINSPSHCGVEFIRSLSQLQQRALARDLAHYPKFKVFTPKKA